VLRATTLLAAAFHASEVTYQRVALTSAAAFWSCVGVVAGRGGARGVVVAVAAAAALLTLGRPPPSAKTNSSEPASAADVGIGMHDALLVALTQRITRVAEVKLGASIHNEVRVALSRRDAISERGLDHAATLSRRLALHELGERAHALVVPILAKARERSRHAASLLLAPASHTPATEAERQAWGLQMLRGKPTSPPLSTRLLLSAALPSPARVPPTAAYARAMLADAVGVANGRHFRRAPSKTTITTATEAVNSAGDEPWTGNVDPHIASADFSGELADVSDNDARRRQRSRLADLRQHVDAWVAAYAEEHGEPPNERELSRSVRRMQTEVRRLSHALHNSHEEAPSSSYSHHRGGGQRHHRHHSSHHGGDHPYEQYAQQHCHRHEQRSGGGGGKRSISGRSSSGGERRHSSGNRRAHSADHHAERIERHAERATRHAERHAVRHAERHADAVYTSPQRERHADCHSSSHSRTHHERGIAANPVAARHETPPLALSSLSAAMVAERAVKELERREGRVLSPSSSSKSRPPVGLGVAARSAASDGGRDGVARDAREIESTDLDALPAAPADVRTWLPAGFTDDDDDAEEGYDVDEYAP